MVWEWFWTGIDHAYGDESSQIIGGTVSPHWPHGRGQKGVRTESYEAWSTGQIGNEWERRSLGRFPSLKEAKKAVEGEVKIREVLKRLDRAG